MEGGVLGVACWTGWLWDGVGDTCFEYMLPMFIWSWVYLLFVSRGCLFLTLSMFDIWWCIFYHCWILFEE